ncbi:MAG: RNA methyltransferase [Paenibacillaceae bacterium]
MDILSVHNNRVKQWAALRDRKYRDRENKYIIEGIHLVQEALTYSVPMETLIFSLDRGLPDDVSQHLQAGVELIGVSEAVLAKICDTISPQAVVAIMHKSKTEVKDILDHHRSLVMVIDGIQDPGNLGTIIRSADAVGASAVLLGKGTVDLYNAKTIRATMGSMYHLAIAECDLNAILPLAKLQGVQVMSTRIEQSVSCYDADFTKDTWIIVGNEGQGVSRNIAQYADLFLHIPMLGKAESLNVAMASTVLLFEAMRQRRVHKGVLVE